MRITISRPVNGVSLNGGEYALGGDGKALSFASVREAVNYLADRNWEAADLREVDFNVEEAE
jgi:hypothetical protein